MQVGSASPRHRGTGERTTHGVRMCIHRVRRDRHRPGCRVGTPTASRARVHLHNCGLPPPPCASALARRRSRRRSRHARPRSAHLREHRRGGPSTPRLRRPRRPSASHPGRPGTANGPTRHRSGTFQHQALDLRHEHPSPAFLRPLPRHAALVPRPGTGAPVLKSAALARHRSGGALADAEHGPVERVVPGRAGQRAAGRGLKRLDEQGDDAPPGVRGGVAGGVDDSRRWPCGSVPGPRGRSPRAGGRWPWRGR